MRRRNLLFTLPPILADCNTKTTQHGWRDVRPIALRRRVKLAGMSTVTLEVVETQDQWRRAVALRNAYNPDGPITVERAMNYAAARHSAHMFLVSVKPIDAANERTGFLDYMSTMYRRMLNEHLDGMGEERGIDVGESELAAEYAAAGVQVGRAKQTPAADYVAASGATPPAASNE